MSVVGRILGRKTSLVQLTQYFIYQVLDTLGDYDEGQYGYKESDSVS